MQTESKLAGADAWNRQSCPTRSSRSVTTTRGQEMGLFHRRAASSRASRPTKHTDSRSPGQTCDRSGSINECHPAVTGPADGSHADTNAQGGTPYCAVAPTAKTGDQMFRMWPTPLTPTPRGSTVPEPTDGEIPTSRRARTQSAERNTDDTAKRRETNAAASRARWSRRLQASILPLRIGGQTNRTAADRAGGATADRGSR